RHRQLQAAPARVLLAVLGGVAGGAACPAALVVAPRPTRLEQARRELGAAGAKPVTTTRAPWGPCSQAFRRYAISIITLCLLMTLQLRADSSNCSQIVSLRSSQSLH